MILMLNLALTINIIKSTLETRELLLSETFLALEGDTQ